ncbi:Ig-like domain-containing protein [Clostridium sp.]|uniref:Ig-like domain-containing protein n=1 Tax=Clostridium sp. TaxID=1506 RepID=UPI00321655DF
MKNVKMLIVISMICIGIVTLGGCGFKDKETVISDNVEKEIQVEENEIDKYIEEGNKYLKEEKYDEARKSYEAAIAKGKSDRQIYIDIGEEYIKYKRYDDAYAIIKMAVDNNVDLENMKSRLININSNFQAISLSDEIYQGDLYVLPEQVEVSVNGEKIKDYVIWSKEASTSTLGSIQYQGITREYGRTVNLELEVKENVYESKIGFIRDIYTENNIVYICFDEVKFYRGDEAVTESMKLGRGSRTPDGFILPNSNKEYENQGQDVITAEDKNYYIINDYYIKYLNNSKTTYTIDKNATFKMLAYEINPKNNSVDLQEVDYNTLKNYIDNWKNTDAERAILFWIDMKNDIVIEMYKQFTP